jgi:hypothetical protein
MSVFYFDTSANEKLIISFSFGHLNKGVNLTMNKKRLKQLGLVMLLGPPLSVLAASNIDTSDK